MLAPETSAYREAMARLGAAVNIVTTGTLDNPVGFTASAVCSVTDTPPTLLVCLNRNSRARSAFYEGGAMCVNVLTSSQQDLSNHFASPNTMQSALPPATGRHWPPVPRSCTKPPRPLTARSARLWKWAPIVFFLALCRVFYAMRVQKGLFILTADTTLYLISRVNGGPKGAAPLFT